MIDDDHPLYKQGSIIPYANIRHSPGPLNTAQALDSSILCCELQTTKSNPMTQKFIKFYHLYPFVCLSWNTPTQGWPLFGLPGRAVGDRAGSPTWVGQST